MVQALVADQSALAAISEAILSAIKPVLPEHIAAQNTSQKVAEPLGQSTNLSAGASVDQTVQETKRKNSDPIDLTESEDHASQKRSHTETRAAEKVRTRPWTLTKVLIMTAVLTQVPAGRRAKN